MLIDIATAVPPFKITQERATEELVKRMGGRPAIGRMVRMAASRSDINSRYVVLPEAEEHVSEGLFSEHGGYVRPGTKARMELYEQWSKNLSVRAVQDLLNATGTSAEQIHRLITISCTGFVAPGIDYHIIQELNLPRTVRRRHIGFMGCAAALIGLQSIFELDERSPEGSNSVLVSVELCSLHLQTEPTVDNILANILFADGAAAVLLSASRPSHVPRAFKFLHSMSVLFDGSSSLMGWKIGDFGFEMMLSQDLPKTIESEAVPALRRMLERIGISLDQIRHWALHPGGRAILDALQAGLGLADRAMAPSRCILQGFGNMSSATILFVLKNILASGDVEVGDLCCAVAFGPGLTMEVVLLKAV